MSQDVQHVRHLQRGTRTHMQGTRAMGQLYSNDLVRICEEVVQRPTTKLISLMHDWTISERAVIDSAISNARTDSLSQHTNRSKLGDF